MNEKRLNEANENFRQFLADSLIVKEEFRKDVFDRYYENSLESIRAANNLYENRISFLWTIVTCYYAMFYIASAYVYRKGYKASHQIVHKVINEALISLARKEIAEKMIEYYQEEKDKALSIAENLLDNFEYERSKRSRFQYEMTEDIKQAKAKTSISRAKEFIDVFRKILE